MFSHRQFVNNSCQVVEVAARNYDVKVHHEVVDVDHQHKAMWWHPEGVLQGNETVDTDCRLIKLNVSEFSLLDNGSLKRVGTWRENKQILHMKKVMIF